MRGSTAFLVVLVAALGVGLLILFQRQQALTDRLGELEVKLAVAKSVRPAEPVPEAASIPAPPMPIAAPQAVELPRPVAEPDLRRPAAPSVAPEALPPGVQAAVAKEVDRLMKERGGMWLDSAAMQDPIALMEKELGLSPAQKLRIQDYWKRRDDAILKLAGDGFKNPGEHLRKATEIEEEYETAVKRELDFSQQEKYDALKREGKLINARGAVIRLNVQKVEK